MNLYEFGPFELDAARLLLLERGAHLPLGPKVVETLLALIEHPGEVVSKRDLLVRIWPEGYVDEANLAQNVYVLRKMLRERWNVAAIETIPRRGYRFTAPVRCHDVPRPQPARTPAPRPALPFPRAVVVAAAVAVALLGGSQLSSGSPHRSGRAGVAAGAARLYAMGRYYWNLRTPAGVAKSVEYFARVVADDPQGALGYAGLASADAIMADYGYGPVSKKVAISRARAYAQEALAIDPRSSEAYAVLGLIATEASAKAPKRAAAVADFRRAIALDSSNGAAHEWYGVALLQQGRVTQAYGELARAAQLEPLSVATVAWLGTTAYLEGHYRDAIAYASEALDLSPQRTDAYETLGLAYEVLGERTRASRTFERLAHACRDCRPEAAALLAALDARSNRMKRARAELAIAQARPEEVSPEDLGVALEAVGEAGPALAWFRRWRDDDNYATTQIANDPRFAVLRRSKMLADKPA